MSRPRDPDDEDLLSPELLLRAYAAGIFPMADSRAARGIFWVDPRVRGVLPLDAFHVPRSLKKTMRRKPFEVRVDSQFEAVMRACAEPRPGHPDTWINESIVQAFVRLHELGHAHSVECWRDGQLVGGLYGLALAGAFFGESMFSQATDASKVALVHLVARLRFGGFVLLDVQFLTDHLSRFGVVEIPAREYLQRLGRALATQATFYGELSEGAVESLVGAVLRQSITQTS